MSVASQPSATWQLSGQLSDEESTRRFIINRSPYTVGRGPDQELTIASTTVSGRHAELLIQDGELIVRDLNSTNGTFLNGVRVEGACSVNHGDLVQFAEVVFRASIDAPVRHSQTVQNDAADQALALIQFERLISERAVAPHFQPIVTMAGEPFGYEVLGRSRLFGLSTPHAMFSAAAVLNLEAELSRVMRYEGVRAATNLPGQYLLFVNTHPIEIDEIETLLFSLRELREMAATRPIVLEIHEATVTRSDLMKRLREELNNLQMGLAYDDFGAGQARLVELAETPPDYLKFDMKLVQGIGSAPASRQKMLQRLVEMTVDLDIVPLAEGVEHEEDNRVCEELGFQCAQGYLHGRPAPVEQLPVTEGCSSC